MKCHGKSVYRKNLTYASYIAVQYYVYTSSNQNHTLSYFELNRYHNMNLSWK